MSRRSLTYVCQNCGGASARWQGKCEACGEWNSMVEEGDGLAGLGGEVEGLIHHQGSAFEGFDFIARIGGKLIRP